ncbi:2-hydroxychromene-2-carboxylate isomerase [Sediminicurvatus halobius]|uniref:2-hydroxychromene-2-carboxylate isomerase n=1 Tax=Sediminicurvatus halobius TaxID=2182432 RepID=A0A2U2N948_9GAMM|nr:2-hydroxychromene-2-carboxylate isomerase [Spiribacter halobius]PWG65519.1 2-hydroxychromene-2-carboxylate isomerase [Spiribacter halobius]UEX76544.1 2-hydroxychromene-2-carboxylate isomerase [Spiribacter halobius]
MKLDHYCSLLSPWVFLGWPELEQIARRHGAELRHVFVRLPEVFEANGGVPGGKKSAAKQRYRDMELRRWSHLRGTEVNPHPDHHPFRDERATRLVLAAEDRGEDFTGLAYRMMRALWQENRNLADEKTLATLVRQHGLDVDALFDTADGSRVGERLDAQTREAIDAGVFGVPTYRLGDELFWGQDRLDLLERALQ